MLLQGTTMDKRKASLYNGGTLAYIGDTVYQILVQEYLLETHDATAAELHRLATEMVNHDFQSDAMDRLLPQLDETERSIYNRGRNSPQTRCKRSDPAAHCRATGFEALMGYLYLAGEQERLNRLFRLAVEG